MNIRYYLIIPLTILFVLIVCSCSIHGDKYKKIFNRGKESQFNQNNISIDQPVYSLDDKYILFSARLNGKSSIYRINSDGSNLTKLTGPFGYDDDNPISLPNHKVLFSSYETHGACADFCIIDIDGKNFRRITNHGNGGSWKAYSSLTNTIYFVTSCDMGNNSTDKDIYDIWAIDLNGMNRCRITSLKDFFMRSLSISNHGKKLLFQRQSFMNNPREDSLWLLDLDTRELRPIKPNIHGYLSNYSALKIRNKEPWENSFGNMDSPQLSPSGNQVLFVWPGHYQGYFGHEIYLMDLKSSSTKKLTDLKGFIANPSFSHDGKKIVFSLANRYTNNRPESFDLWKINTDGTQLERIDITFGNGVTH